MQVLTTERTRELCRRHAAEKSSRSSAYVINDIDVNIRHLERRHIERRIRRIEDEARKDEARKLVRQHARLARAMGHLTSVRGIGDKSALTLLGELLSMPGGLGVREWVAYPGLDVRRYESGSSVRKPGRISKEGNVHIRRVLYMPALVASRSEPHVRAFYEKLTGRGKKPLAALVAVMRKLLHAIYGMLKHDQDFDGSKFYRMEPRIA